MKKKILLLTLTLLIGIAGMVNAAVIVHDDFDNSILEPSWDVSFENATGFTYSETGSGLTVSDILSSGENQWNRISLSQSFDAISDYNIDFGFSWVEEDNAMQNLFLKLYTNGGTELVTSVGFYDAWVATNGKMSATVSTNGTNLPSNLGLEGSALVNLNRQQDTVSIMWNQIELLTAENADPIDKVAIVFDYYDYSGGSAFGSETVDLIHVEGDMNAAPVPEPATMVLLSSGLLGMAGISKFDKPVY